MPSNLDAPLFIYGKYYWITTTVSENRERVRDFRVKPDAELLYVEIWDGTVLNGVNIVSWKVDENN
jgi:hypothetical protein